ncbi:MAG TPA: phosphatase PAP2 family protein [Gemmatimonadaceae bacterium]
MKAAWRSYESAPFAVRAAIALTVTLAVFAIPAFGDQWAYAHVYQAKVYDHDWAMALRATGTLYVWIPVALILWLVERERDAGTAKRRALLVLGSPVLAGALCEVFKLLIRRERPDVDLGNYVFRAWSDHPFSSAGLSTPSSHTMVAFGAATMLARMYPRARWVFYLFAVGCATTRVMAHAHYLSDVTFGALLGWAVAWGLWMEVGRPRMEDGERGLSAAA